MSLSRSRSSGLILEKKTEWVRNQARANQMFSCHFWCRRSATWSSLSNILSCVKNIVCLWRSKAPSHSEDFLRQPIELSNRELSWQTLLIAIFSKQAILSFSFTLFCKPFPTKTSKRSKKKQNNSQPLLRHQRTTRDFVKVETTCSHKAEIKNKTIRSDS